MAEHDESLPINQAAKRENVTEQELREMARRRERWLIVEGGREKIVYTKTYKGGKRGWAPKLPPPPPATP